MISANNLILEDILRTIERKGLSSIDWKILLNMSFRSDTGDSWAKMQKWPKANDLRVSERHEKLRGKTRVTLVFSKIG